MKRPLVALRRDLAAVVAAEVTAAGCAAVLLAAGVPMLAALISAVIVAVALCLVSVADLAGWQWVRQAAHWVAHRQRRIALPDWVDIEVEGSPVGVLIDGHTVVTMISVWGKPYVPTLLYPQRAQTPNTLPITVIAEHMHRAGLGVDVDVICEGRRTTRDPYADLYATFLGGRPAAGQRTTTLVVRLDTRAADTISGLLWRRNSVEAATAATRRIVRALRQVNCRAQILTSAQIREAVVAGLGDAGGAEETYRDQWNTLHRPGHGYVTSYYLSSDDLCAAHLGDVWSYDTEQTVLVVALRRSTTGIRASAVVRLSTPQPLPVAPSPVLNRFTGRQWEALAKTLPGRDRINGLPSTPVDTELDTAVIVGPSGVLIGKFGDALLLMPLSDPAAPTRIAIRADNKVVRQLIRRAAATGERVAVYDDTGNWSMTAASSRIWTTRDMHAQPPRPPTLVVHNGGVNPYPGAWALVTVGGLDLGNPDVIIEQKGGRIQLCTKRFRTVIEPVTFRSEEPYLN
ncbi:MAG: type VII secretion protein EccE [Mycobacteriaceae bacterium]|nr:type VII secretion protein EccE [Mycobacteriaceae bacterium]